MQQASLFYGGQIYGNLGAFVQGTYDKAAQHTFLDNTDIRYADTTQIGGDRRALSGVDVNNDPTVQDVWNTTPAWGFPYVAATLAPAFAPPGTQIEGGFGGRSVGTGAYVFLKDMLYLEASAYNNLSKGELNAHRPALRQQFRLCAECDARPGRRNTIRAEPALIALPAPPIRSPTPRLTGASRWSRAGATIR